MDWLKQIPAKLRQSSSSVASLEYVSVASSANRPPLPRPAIPTQRRAAFNPLRFRAVPPTMMGHITRRDFVTPSVMTLPGVLLASRQATASAGAAHSDGAPDPQLIEDLVSANHILADEGIADGYGHVSARHDRNPGRYLLSRDLAPALVTTDDTLEYDLDSNPIDSKGRSQYLERFIHGEIYNPESYPS
jgi:Class II Aldolase and Adducin N-terminal domain